MKVKDLVEVLKNLNQDLYVFTENGQHEIELISTAIESDTSSYDVICRRDTPIEADSATYAVLIY